MKKGKMTALLVASSCALVAAGAVAMSQSAKNGFKIIKADPADPYLNSVVIEASDIDGSGTLEKDGTTFTYTGISVDGSNILVAASGTFVAVSGSGDSSTGLSGAGFVQAQFLAGANYNDNVTLNGSSVALILTSGNTTALDVNSVNFSFSPDAALVAQSITLTYQCKYTTTQIDALPNDAIWTEDVLSTNFSVDYDDNYQTEVYGTKQIDGIYIYVEQHVETQKTHASDWWENDNIEFRFRADDKFIGRFAPGSYTSYYLSRLNGGAGNADDYAVSDYTQNSSTGLYDLTYEAFYSWTTLGLSYSDEIMVIAGVNYYGENNERWTTSSGWNQFYMHDSNVIRADGAITYNCDVLEGTEKVTSTITGGDGTNWNYRMANLDMSTADDFVLHAKITAQNGENYQGDLSSGFVGEFMNDDEDGGWRGMSWRKDWCGWNQWYSSNGESDYSEISTDSDWSVAGAAFAAASNDMTYDVVYSFSVSTKQVSILVKGTSNVEGNLGLRYYISMISAVIDTDTFTHMNIGVGYNQGKATCTSYRIIKGNQA
ncbi:MAG: hypothetical protein K6F07_03525, partial [Bacilli bacterium]|nr:hypothetical protein [Bacilli bacterium]